MSWRRFCSRSLYLQLSDVLALQSEPRGPQFTIELFGILLQTDKASTNQHQQQVRSPCRYPTARALCKNKFYQDVVCLCLNYNFITYIYSLHIQFNIIQVFHTLKTLSLCAPRRRIVNFQINQQRVDSNFSSIQTDSVNFCQFVTVCNCKNSNAECLYRYISHTKPVGCTALITTIFLRFA